MLKALQKIAQSILAVEAPRTLWNRTSLFAEYHALRPCRVKLRSRVTASWQMRMPAGRAAATLQRQKKPSVRPAVPEESAASDYKVALPLASGDGGSGVNNLKILYHPDAGRYMKSTKNVKRSIYRRGN
jgi:hypothetical protein